jgi:hypothetical protein
VILNWPDAWPTPPPGWSPPAGWKPDPSWPPPPPDWILWLPETDASQTEAGPSSVEDQPAPQDTTATQPATDSRQLADSDELTRLRERVHHLEQATPALTPTSPDSSLDFDDARMLQDLGIYRYHHPLDDSPAYKERLNQLNHQIDEQTKSGHAVLVADMFTWNGSLAQGRALVRDLSKLMLRAYNAEADNCVRSLRSGNIRAATRRLDAAMTAIGKLGAMMELRINPEYHQLRLTELELVADYQMKLAEERERAREQRELLREQRQVELELAAERARLDKERTHYLTVLENLRASGDLAAAEELGSRLAQIDAAIAANDFRAANVRAGYVYVISNIGAFGPNVVKIGMTRRLEPHDRIRELGDASVPFSYDVHALFFSEDAVTLENELHKAFSTRRLNWVNPRREFFFATPAEVRKVLDQKTGGLLEYNIDPEALEYNQSRGSWPEIE